VFPLRDENPTRNRAWMTWLLVAANVGVFLYEFYLQNTAGAPAFERFVSAWAFDASRLAGSPLGPQTWVTMITSMFLHAGWVHLIGNMLYLAVFGNNVEDRLGSWRFLGFYLASGIVAAIVQAAAAGFAPGLMLGASGAVAGTLGAYALLFPRSRVLTAIWVFVFVELARVPAWLLIGVWFLLQLANGLVTLTPGAAPSGVAYLAHVGGFGAGMAMAAPLRMRGRRRARVRS